MINIDRNKRPSVDYIIKKYFSTDMTYLTITEDAERIYPINSNSSSNIKSNHSGNNDINIY